ncbi:TolC family protein [Desulfovibrio subterraneus]|jgi:adhesin transport system outer membrane protein|uniref:Channel protein TolC n=1 Tax=Desulfovibrio subterraneus TaxID=2718620 RepID=A0A7J0BHW4_9BACT|nr:TolC family protein [Desulfovibrio subterraneus]WBF66977.1 TolC family protein [Desulfovibrio subterraneus]GFM32705.1 channel protein TolC [Desulfovibrio subterraneus]
MKRLGALLAAAVFCFGGAASAQARNLGDLLPELLERHERVLAKDSQTKAAAHTVDVSRSGWFPRLDVTSDVSSEQIERPGSQPNDYTSRERNMQRVRGTQLLYDFDATTLRVEQSESLLERSRLEQVSTRQDLLLEGIGAYLDVFKAYKRLEYATRSEERIKQQTGIEETLVQRGAGVSSDVLQAKQQLLGAMALRVNIEGELARARARFRSLFGYAPDMAEINTFEKPVVPADLLPVSPDDAAVAAIDGSPLLKAADATVQASAKQVDIDRTRFYPNFNLFAEARRRENDTGDFGVREDSSVGVEMQWNLFSGFGDEAQLSASRASEAQARYTQADMRRTVEENVRVAWQDLRTSRRNAKLLREQTEILGEFMDMAKRERKLGTRSLLDVLVAEVNYINAVSLALAAETDAIRSGYATLHAMGKLDLSLFANR